MYLQYSSLGVLYCTVQYCTVPYCTVPYCTVPAMLEPGCIRPRPRGETPRCVHVTDAPGDEHIDGCTDRTLTDEWTGHLRMHYIARCVDTALTDACTVYYSYQQREGQTGFAEGCPEGEAPGTSRGKAILS